VKLLGYFVEFLGSTRSRFLGKPGFRRALRHQLFLTIQMGLNFILAYLFVRVLAVSLGTTGAKDSFDVAFSVPYMIVDICGFVFLHGIIMTQFAGTVRLGSSELNRLFGTCLNVMSMFAFVIVVPVALFTDSLVEALGKGLSPANKYLTADLIRITLPLVFTLGVSTYFSAVLLARDIPFAIESCQLVSRLGAILWVWVMNFNYSLSQLATVVVISSTLALAAQWIMLRRFTAIRYAFALDWNAPAFVVIRRQAAGFIVASFAALLASSYMRRLATLDGEGTTAALGYAFTISTALAVIVGKPVSATLGVRHVRLLENGSTARALRQFFAILAVCLVIGLVTSLLLNALSSGLIELLYGGGAFDHHSVQITAEFLRILAWSVPPVIILWVCLMPLLSLKRRQSAALIYTIGWIIQIALSRFLFEQYGRDGLAWAYVFAMFSLTVLALGFVSRELLLPHESVVVHK